MIYYDPTEARDNTRLSRFITENGKPMDGLEAETGADLLIHPNATLTRLDKPPANFVWKKSLSLVVQRKTGGDALSSIRDNKYPHILQRMQQNGPNAIPWLLIDGEFFSSQDGYVVLDGQRQGYRWSAFEGVMDWWQLRGGYVHWSPDPDSCAEWLLRWDKNIDKLTHETVIGPRPFVQELKGGLFDEHPWRATLQTFPEVGSRVAADIIQHYPDSLADALAWMSFPDDTIPGIGKVTKAAWRKWLGLGEHEILFKYNDAPTDMAAMSTE